jgi:hypothetical protein
MKLFLFVLFLSFSLLSECGKTYIEDSVFEKFSILGKPFGVGGMIMNNDEEVIFVLSLTLRVIQSQTNRLYFLFSSFSHFHHTHTQTAHDVITYL